MYNLSCIQHVIYIELENPEIDDDDDDDTWTHWTDDM